MQLCVKSRPLTLASRHCAYLERERVGVSAGHGSHLGLPPSVQVSHMTPSTGVAESCILLHLLHPMAHVRMEGDELPPWVHGTDWNLSAARGCGSERWEEIAQHIARGTVLRRRVRQRESDRCCRVLHAWTQGGMRDDVLLLRGRLSLWRGTKGHNAAGGMPLNGGRGIPPATSTCAYASAARAPVCITPMAVANGRLSSGMDPRSDHLFSPV
jgi:hypothetical protein